MDDTGATPGTEPDTVNVHEAKTNLSKLLERVEAGRDVIIARNGRPVARLTSVAAEKPKRVPGLWKDIEIPDSFFDPMTEDELAEWYK
jgi:prevent-host-death family protein